MSDVVKNILNLYYGIGEHSDPKPQLPGRNFANILQREDSNVEPIVELGNDFESFETLKNESKILEKKTPEENVSEIFTRSSRVLEASGETDEPEVEDAAETLLFPLFHSGHNYCNREKGISTSSGATRAKCSTLSERTQLLESASFVPHAHFECETSDVTPSDAELQSCTHGNSSSTSMKIDAKENEAKSSPEKSAAKKEPVYDETYLDLSSTTIDSFPVELLDRITNIRMLYLENNNLSEIPDEIFTYLTRLEWFDARRNQITDFPKTVKGHESLDTILLQGNKLQTLPLELGLVPKLKRLQLTGNPLEFPQEYILALGFSEIVRFLRREWNTKNPEEKVELDEEKAKSSSSTILCIKEKPTRKVPFTQLANGNSVQKKISVRERSWNYQMSNRCESNGTDIFEEQKHSWIAKVKDAANKRNRILQKISTEKVLKEWRQNNSSFEKSMKKTAKKLDDTGKTSFTRPKRKNLEKPPENIDKRMNEIVASINKFQFHKLTNATPRTEKNNLHLQCQKLSELQDQIQTLKKYNDLIITPKTSQTFIH